LALFELSKMRLTNLGKVVSPDGDIVSGDDAMKIDRSEKPYEKADLPIRERLHPDSKIRPERFEQ
jgi:hypothetical protein